MDESFRIPQSEAGAISHTPSVVYTPDGKKMVTATSNGEIIVFETSTQKILRRIEFPGELSDAVSIDARARLTSTKNDNERKALEACKKSLEAENSVQHAVGTYASLDNQLVLNQLANGIVRVPGLGLEGVPDDIAKMVSEHREQLQREVVRLQSSFCLNQWKFVKPDDGRKR